MGWRSVCFDRHMLSAFVLPQKMANHLPSPSFLMRTRCISIRRSLWLVVICRFRGIGFGLDLDLDLDLSCLSVRQC